MKHWMYLISAVLASLALSACFDPYACEVDTDCFRGHVCSDRGRCVSAMDTGVDTEADGEPAGDTIGGVDADGMADDRDSSSRDGDVPSSDTRMAEETAGDDAGGGRDTEDASPREDADDEQWSCSKSTDEEEVDRCAFGTDYEPQLKDARFRLGCSNTKKFYRTEIGKWFCSCADDDRSDHFQINYFDGTQFGECPDTWDPEKHDEVKVTVTVPPGEGDTVRPQLDTANSRPGEAWDSCLDSKSADVDYYWCDRDASSDTFVFHWDRSQSSGEIDEFGFQLRRENPGEGPKFRYRIDLELVGAPDG